MLRQEDIRIDVGRCVGGTFLRVTHIPSGVTRHKAPLCCESSREVAERFLREIERELVDRGLSCHVFPAYRKKYREV